MGKPTGFMEFKRENKKELSIIERIKNFDDFHIPFDLKKQREQASRCMNCGIPFCQSAMKVNGRNVGGIVGIGRNPRFGPFDIWI